MPSRDYPKAWFPFLPFGKVTSGFQVAKSKEQFLFLVLLLTQKTLTLLTTHSLLKMLFPWPLWYSMLLVLLLLFGLSSQFLWLGFPP